MTVYWLRYWLILFCLFFTSITVGIYFKDHSFLFLIYNNNNEISHLLSRVFACLSMLMALLTAHCAYEMHNKRFYSLCLWGFMVLLIHFVSEMTFFFTVKATVYSIAFIFLLGMTLGWMVFAYPKYVSKHSHTLESMHASRQAPVKTTKQH